MTNTEAMVQITQVLLRREFVDTGRKDFGPANIAEIQIISEKVKALIGATATEHVECQLELFRRYNLV